MLLTAGPSFQLLMFPFWHFIHMRIWIVWRKWGLGPTKDLLSICSVETITLFSVILITESFSYFYFPKHLCLFLLGSCACTTAQAQWWSRSGRSNLVSLPLVLRDITDLRWNGPAPSHGPALLYMDDQIVRMGVYDASHRLWVWTHARSPPSILNSYRCHVIHQS